MKKILIASALAAAFVAPQAFAQARNFEGFSLGANLNIANAATEVTSTPFNGKPSESSQNLGLQAQYNWALGDAFVLGAGLGLGVGDLKGGEFTAGGTFNAKQKEAYSLYVAPGVALNDSVLLYGKVAALSGKVELTGPGLSNSTTVNGVGYGLGVQSYLNKNLFIQGELMQNNYNEVDFDATSKGKFNSAVFSIGVGYRF